MFKKILVPVDGSPYAWKALETAIELGRKFEGEIAVVNVVQPYNIIQTNKNLELGDNPMEEETVAKYEDVFNDLFNQISNKIIDAAREKTAGYQYSTAFFIKVGYPYEEIVDLAKEINADAIVMGSRGLSGIAELLMGSVSTKVAQHADVPVLIVK